MPHILTPTDAVTLRQEGTRVLVLKGGCLLADMPYEAALDVGRALIAQARKAEELAKVQQIIGDQAIILRAGFPVGLTNHPDIQAEAAKEAAWNTRLRRYMPGGVRSQEAVGTPTLIQHPPRSTPPPQPSPRWGEECTGGGNLGKDVR